MATKKPVRTKSRGLRVVSREDMIGFYEKEQRINERMRKQEEEISNNIERKDALLERLRQAKYSRTKKSIAEHKTADEFTFDEKLLDKKYEKISRDPVGKIYDQLPGSESQDAEYNRFANRKMTMAEYLEIAKRFHSKKMLSDTAYKRILREAAPVRPAPKPKVRPELVALRKNIQQRARQPVRRRPSKR